MSSKSNKKLPPLADQTQRDMILTELDKNILVEAAAGTGKTTSMIGRMIALIKSGECKHVRTMAAVTFTRKAAAELRSRFQVELEKAIRETEGEEKENLIQALDNIEQCFVGTIHSFCARILRERPVEANVDLSFTEIDEESDSRLRAEAWELYSARLFTDESDTILSELNQYGLQLSQLADTFQRFADYPDVEYWELPDDDLRLPDPEPVMHQVMRYIEHMEELRYRLPSEWGNDSLIPNYLRIPRIVSHYKHRMEPVELMEILTFFDFKIKLVQKEWVKTGNFSKEEAIAERDRWDSFRDDVAEPLLRIWRELRYKPIIRAMLGAKEIYDHLRHSRGLLNFQDLLMKTASLLRDKPNIRRYFSRRYTHLLVDEFQDTDPVQAEVMHLLTADNIHETNWRKCKPRPGALFVVGDPKQSIYRFRRADIVTYNEVKDIIGKQDNGLILQLSTNFRTIGSIIDWVNRVFEPDESNGEQPASGGNRFPATHSPQSPAYVPLNTGRVEGNKADYSTVFSLRIPSELAKREFSVEYEADRIARIIKQAIDLKMLISRTISQIENGVSPEAGPDDFMIITRNRRDLSLYARKLQEYGIPHHVTGGSALNEVFELKLLYHCLNAVVHPENPVALVATLRSELFGISDVSLYRFKKHGGEFVYTGVVPDTLPDNDRQVFVDTFSRLRRYARWFSVHPPITTIEKVVADLGLMAQCCSIPEGDQNAGSLAKAIEILRNAQADTWSVSQIVDYMRQLTDMEEKYDGISIHSHEIPAVRIMNLHKAKGLEAPVIFLANPFGEKEREPELHINRFGDKVKGYMPVLGYGNRKLAQPPRWDELAEIEAEFQDADVLRLRYVAATRACSAMVVTLQTAGRHRRHNPWQHFEEHLNDAPEVGDPDVKPVDREQEAMLDTMKMIWELDEIAVKHRIISRPTYLSSTAKFMAREYFAEDAAYEMTRDTAISETGIESAGEHGTEWGTAIHSLLQIAMESGITELEDAAKAVLAENDIHIDFATEAVELVRSVMQSEIWTRAQNSDRCFTEVPFQILLGEEHRFSKPVIVRGTIDLVFYEDDGWTLVDYKTGIGKTETLVKKYAPQLELYARAWRICTNQPVREKLILFIATNELAVIEQQTQ
ncbi:MAG: AAA family ATPase [candidate division Zixibacteria bacterium]|nr:AAA family ATPase [candidate division Zixibacteria bacterium]